MTAVHQFTAALPTTPLIDAAAALETRTHEAEARARVLQRDLQELRRRHEQILQWLRMIRRAHRSSSHAVTGRLIRDVLVSVDPPVALPQSRPLSQKR